MTITKKMYLSDVFSLDNKVVLSTISSQLTAHSSQLTAHSSQLTAHSSQLTKSSFNQNNILFYNNKFINKKSSHRFVRIANSSMTALFLCFASGTSTVFCETKQIRFPETVSELVKLSRRECK